MEQVNCGTAAVHCTQIKPTIWSEPFDHALREAGDDNDDDVDHDDILDDDDDDPDDDVDHDDDDNDGDDFTCESAIGVRRGEDELI